MSGQGRAPPPSNPHPWRGWSTPSKPPRPMGSRPLIGAAGYLSLTVHFTPAHPASRTARPLQFSFAGPRPTPQNRLLRLPRGGRVPRSLTPLGYSVDTFRSGSSGASLPRRPLRTGRADRPASGSSHYSAPRFGTGPLCGRFRGSTMGEVLVPHWIEWAGRSADFDVSPN